MKNLDLYDFLFIVFILCVIVGNVSWFLADNSIKGNDSPNHLLFSINFYYQFAEAIGREAPLVDKIVNSICVLGAPFPGMGGVYWPNGVNLTAYFCYSLFGKSLFAAKMAILPYLVILLFSTYSLGRFLHSKFVGFMAAFYLFCYPIIFQSSRQYQLDLPLTAFVALILYLLLNADRFNNTKYSSLLGLACGYAMLIKGQVVFFIACPFLYMLYRMGRESGKEIVRNPIKSKQLRNLLMALIVSGLIASIWWGSKATATVASFKMHMIDPAKCLENTPFAWDKKYSLESLFFYVWTLFYSSVRPILSVLLFMLLPALLREKIKHKGFYMLWIIPPLLLFSLAFTIKHSRFMMPILPAVALITALGLQCVPNKKLKYSILSVSVIFCLMQFYVLSYADYRIRLFSIGPFKILGEQGWGSNYETDAPYIFDFKIDNVGSIIRNNTARGHAPRILLVETNNVMPQYEEIYFWLKLKDAFLEVTDLEGVFRMPGRLDNVDFIVCHTSTLDPMQWFETRKFINVFGNSYFAELRIFEAEAQSRGEMPAWEGFLGSLELAAANFPLIGKVNETITTYYIYKRNPAPAQSDNRYVSNT